MTVPIEHNSTQEKKVQAKERKILSITNFQVQLQRIRQQREQKQKREDDERELQCFNEFINFTRNEFEKAWSKVRASIEKKNTPCTRRECNRKKMSIVLAFSETNKKLIISPYKCELFHLFLLWCVV